MSRTRLVLALAAAAVVVHHCRASAPPPGDAPQAAVLVDGFAVRHGRQVVELEPSGRIRAEHVLDVDGDVRVVGSRVGPIAGWQRGNKVQLARVEDREDLGAWGKSVRQLCDGVATNDANFAIGWLEADESVWIVHGPMAATAEEVAAPSMLRGRDWCGVASAADNIDLFWRERDKLSWQVCTRKACKGLPTRYELAKGSPVLGFGCVEDGCVIASRDRAGAPQLAYVTNKSKVLWTKKLPATSPVSIVAVGSATFVAGYQTSASTAEILRVDRAGNAVTILWSGTHAPSLAWSRDRLVIAEEGQSPRVVPLVE